MIELAPDVLLQVYGKKTGARWQRHVFSVNVRAWRPRLERTLDQASNALPQGVLAGMTADLNDFAVELRQLEALRDRLSRELDRHDAWRALCQLDERERSGHPVLVVESTAIRRSLEAQLRTAVPGWSLLVPLDGLIGALKDPDAYSAAQASTAAVSRLQPATPLVVSAEFGARIEPADASPVRVKIKAGSLIVPNLNIASGPQIPIDQSASDAAVPEAAQGLRSPAIETVSTEALARIRGIRSFDVDAKLDAIDHQANRGPREPVVRETVPVAVASPPPEAERETVRPPESPPVASLAPAAPIPGEANSRNGEDRLAALEAEVDLLITAPRRADQASLSRISGWGICRPRHPRRSAPTSMIWTSRKPKSQSSRWTSQGRLRDLHWRPSRRSPHSRRRLASQGGSASVKRPRSTTRGTTRPLSTTLMRPRSRSSVSTLQRRKIAAMRPEPKQRTSRAARVLVPGS